MVSWWFRGGFVVVSCGFVRFRAVLRQNARRKSNVFFEFHVFSYFHRKIIILIMSSKFRDDPEKKLLIFCDVTYMFSTFTNFSTYFFSWILQICDFTPSLNTYGGSSSCVCLSMKRRRGRLADFVAFFWHDTVVSTSHIHLRTKQDQNRILAYLKQVRNQGGDM